MLKKFLGGLLVLVVASVFPMSATSLVAQTSVDSARTPAVADTAMTAARRQVLVQSIRRKFEQVVKQRLQLTNEQMVKLRQTNRQFEGQRRTLNERERGIRQSMRRELRPGVAADESHLASLTDSLFTVQRSRLDLLQQEQQELSQYMTVVQRVRYYALEEQLRQKLEQVRQRLQASSGAIGAF